MSPYLRRLREAVGNALIVVPAVAVLPFDADGRVLLAFQPDVDAWTTLGGAIEPDETPEAAAMREVAEEAGVSVTLDELVTVLGGPRMRTRYPNGDEAAYVVVVYRGSITDGQPRPDGHEVTALGWFGASELAAVPLSPAARGAFTFLGWIDDAPPRG